MTTKGPKKPAPPARPSRPRPSKTASAKKTAATTPKKTASASTPKRRTLAPAVDVDRELPKIFGGGRPSRPKPAQEEEREEERTARDEEQTPPSEPPASRRAELLSTARLEETLEAPAIEEDERPSTKSRRGAPPMPPPAVVAQIRELEAQLDRLIDEASRRDVSALAGDDDEDDEDLEVTRSTILDGPSTSAEMEREEPPAPAPSIPRPIGSSAAIGAGDRAVFDTARELLSTDFYLRKWGRLAMRGRSEEVDDFGFDPIYDEKVRGVLEFLYTRYFRVEQTGIERVPSRGRCLLVANHSGTLPLDGVMIKTAVKLEHPAGRDVRWLTEDFIYHMPYLGSAMNRLGAVRACQENAERLLAKEELVAVFPEGVKGIGKLFAERYRLQRFGRGGFIKLCLRTATPIVPVAVVGAEETNPMLFRIEYFAKALGVPYVPVTPTFPLLGPAGLLPAPTKWQIHFGEPLDFSAHGADAADDEILVGKLAERVRATIQGMLDQAVGSRKSVFFG